MATFKRSDFGKNPHAGASRNNATQRGWGPGWPNAQTSKMTTVRVAGVALAVRREVADLVETLIELTEAYGYDVKPGDVAGGGTWGFANRPIRGTNTASNHSWGLAVDINSSVNPMQATFRTNIPPKVVHAWEACGWYWGGRYTNRPDTMHFEYLRWPGDVAADLKKARDLLAAARGQAKPAKPAEPGGYLVVPGDTLSQIAERHGVDVDQLAAANQITDPDLLVVGQRLTIPAKAKPAAPAIQELHPRVRPGATHAQIALLQRALIAAGYGPIPHAVTEHYGRETRAAVARFHDRNRKFRERPHDPAIGPKGFRELQRQAYAKGMK
jgi:LysM repeat protein